MPCRGRGRHGDPEQAGASSRTSVGTGWSRGDFLTILWLSPPMPSRVGETHDRWIPARRTLAGIMSVRSSMQSMARPSGSSAARMSRKQPPPADRPRMKMFAVLCANGAPDTIRDLHLLRGTQTQAEKRSASQRRCGFYARAKISLLIIHALALQRPNESNPLGFCCDIVVPVLPVLAVLVVSLLLGWR